MRAPLTSDEWIGRSFLLISFITYVLSNALVLRDSLSVDVKHGEFIFFAAISLLRRPVYSLLATVLGLPIALIYMYGGLLPYSMMVLVLTLSLPLLWEGVRSIIYLCDYRFLFLLVFIAMIPMLLSLPALLDEGLFDTTYGRPRILLGYFHPKEAAISFAIPVLLLMVITRSARVVPLLLGVAALWAVGSRNIALMIFMGWALRWHSRFAFIVLLALLPMCGLWLVFNDDWYVTIDNLMSLRLSVWNDMLNTISVLGSVDVESGDRFGADNFFVEAFIISGPIALLLISFWLISIVFVSRLSNQLSPWPLVCLGMLIFFASFDSGIASTGNFMHVLLWTIVLSPLFNSRPIRQPAFTSIKINN